MNPVYYVYSVGLEKYSHAFLYKELMFSQTLHCFVLKEGCYLSVKF